MQSELDESGWVGNEVVVGVQAILLMLQRVFSPLRSIVLLDMINVGWLMILDFPFNSILRCLNCR